MKLLIWGASVLLCMQSICASTSFTDCEKNLKVLKGDIKQFYEQFEKAQKITRLKLKDIQDLCARLTDALNQLSAKCNSKDAECEAVKFVKLFLTARKEVLGLILVLMYDSILLLDMADEFRCKKDIVCKSAEKTCSCSCETETNRLGCDLLKFFDFIKTGEVKIDQNLLSLLELCNKLNDLTRNFDCTYGPSCGDESCSCSGKSQCNKNLLTAIESFKKDFEKLFSKCQVQVSEIGDICEQVKRRINIELQKA